MFQTNSRIEQKNGIRFYEQDVLLSHYLFTNDITIELTLDYFSPGAGIVLLERNDRIEDAANETYVIKVGQNDFTVLRKRYGVQDEMLHVSSAISPAHKDLKLTFIKRGRSIELKSGDRVVGHYMLPRSIDSYQVGLYSNAGNVFKHASFAVGAPDNWMTNVRNTNGGRVFYFKDGFHIENCEQDAEIEQSNVFLKKGHYYLSYEKDDVSGINDIKSFVYSSSDTRFNDLEKNILSDKNGFELEEDGWVNIKFKGTAGLIKEIGIKDNPMDTYVPTDRSPVVSTGSSVVVTLDGLTAVRWRGTINSIPAYDELTDVRDYGVVSTKSRNYYLSDFRIDLEKEYLFKLDVQTMTVNVYADKETIHATRVIAIKEEDKGKLSLFRNVNALITELVVTRTDGEEVDILIQKTSRLYVPASVKGPIIITDQHNIPLDLSSSYRVSTEADRDDLMLFSNWERETLDPNKPLFLEKAVIDAPGNMRVYGIRKQAVKNIQTFYHITKEIDSIDLYTEQYDVLTEDLFTVDYANNQIRLHKDIDGFYEEIVVDYLKEDSYCINYRKDLHAYEVEISTSAGTIAVMYDYAYTEEGHGTVSEYEITQIKPDPLKNKYIVLRKN